MTQKPETLFWNKLKEKIPPEWHVTRIENRYGGGIPDVYICAEGCSFWIELKVTKTNRINISSHQVAWSYAHYRSGGVSFFLVHPLSSPNLYLFGGDHGRGLVVNGLHTNGSGTVVPCLWSGDDWSGLVGSLVGISRGRVGVGRVIGRDQSGRVGSGSGREPDATEAGRMGSAPGSWPGPGV
jgi:hypothetical protein